MLHATPAASEGVIDTRGIVPPAIPRYFFCCSLPSITSDQTTFALTDFVLTLLKL